MSLYVGTSGWSYREWKPDFYPADIKQKEWLNFYSTRLSACEINATFYRLQANETFARWRDSVPDSFRYSIKAHRRLTHSRRIAPEGEGKDFLAAFFRSLEPLGDRLGIILWQFPPYRKRDDDQLEALLAEIGGRRGAFEFRDDSWLNAEIRARLADAGHTMCVADTTGDPPTSLPPGPVAYIRLRHERYSEEQRDGWRKLLADEADKRDVYAFSKHEGVPAADPFAGVGFATWLCNAGPRQVYSDG
ncbi:MAG TPA: DUF72 domain-containing protein, partial [Actinomycetota bacterium]|nr:DUF72 domain-containing protein [Actinomycetota bacterium]